jgi:hypothetical protein
MSESIARYRIDDQAAHASVVEFTPAGVDAVIVTARRLTVAGICSIAVTFSLASDRGRVFGGANADVSQCCFSRAGSAWRLWVGSLMLNIDGDQVPAVQDTLRLSVLDQ